MISGWDKIEELLKETGYEYFRQGSLNDENQYLPTFFTFWNTSVKADEFYDDRNRKWVATWQIYSYTNDAEKMYSLLDELCLKAKNKGYMIGYMEDVESDRAEWFGRTVDITIYVNLQEAFNG